VFGVAAVAIGGGRSHFGGLVVIEAEEGPVAREAADTLDVHLESHDVALVIALLVDGAASFRSAGFDVHRLYKAYDEQYLMLEAQPAAGPTDALLPQENDLATVTSLVARFERQVRERLQSLSDALARHRAAGHRLAVWGSGSKCVSLISSLGLSQGLGPELVAVVDINPHKHGKFLAGSGLEIVSPDALRHLRPEVVLVMNSIYVDEIRNDLAGRSLHPELIAL